MGQSDYGLMSEICNAHEIDEELIANYLKKYKVLDSLKEKDQTIHFLFNYNTLKLEYLSDNVFDVTGKEKSYFSGAGEDFLKKIFREKDIQIIAREMVYHDYFHPICVRPMAIARTCFPHPSCNGLGP